MSDFLTRLAQRAIGGTSALEPVREPVFPADLGRDASPAVPPPTATTIDGRADADRLQTAPGAVSEHPSERPGQPDVAVRQRADPPARNNTRTPETRPGTIQTVPVLTPRAAEPAGVSSPPPSTVMATGHEQPPQPAAPPLSPKTKPMAAPELGTRNAPRPQETAAVSPLTKELRPARTAPPEQPPSTPAPVTVRIGRIDVRANVQPGAPAPVPRKPERPPALSLEEYLKRREGGRR